MAWDNNFIDDLKMQVNIVDVIGREVDLKKAGANYKGLCPFHSEKTASFMVNEEKQIFNCFGCGEKGDAIKFVESFYKIPFMEAVEKLCDEYGIKMPETKSNGPKIDYQKYYDINAKAARFYYNCLGRGKNNGLFYFKQRSLSKETITKFGLGYAPDSWTLLVDYLRDEKVSDEDMLKLGLAKKGKNGLYDTFRNRVIFPIINTQGKVIGFGARRLDENTVPKYLNSDESDIFLKKNNVFGLNLSKNSISEEDRIVIVEGYMDVISLYQAGVHNVAASLGTALTDNQAKLICRYTKNVVLSYDSDGAGISAALRAIDIFTKAGAKVRVLTVPDGKDPDDFIKKHGKDEFIKLVDNALPATEFKLNNIAKNFNFDSDNDILEYIERILPVLRGLGPIEQDIYIRKLSSKYGVSEKAISMAVQTDSGKKTPSFHVNGRSSKSVNNGNTLRIELSLLVLALNNTDYLDRIVKDGIEFRTPLAKKIMSVEESLANNNHTATHRIDEKIVFEQLEPDEEKVYSNFIDNLLLGPDDEAFYNECRAGFKINQLKEERVEVLNNIAVAEKLDQPEEIEKLARRLIEIDSLIKEISLCCNKEI